MFQWRNCPVRLQRAQLKWRNGKERTQIFEASGFTSITPVSFPPTSLKSWRGVLIACQHSRTTRQPTRTQLHQDSEQTYSRFSRLIWKKVQSLGKYTFLHKSTSRCISYSQNMYNMVVKIEIFTTTKLSTFTTITINKHFSTYYYTITIFILLLFYMDSKHRKIWIESYCCIKGPCVICYN